GKTPGPLRFLGREPRNTRKDTEKDKIGKVVGWVERSEAHQDSGCSWWASKTRPTLQNCLFLCLFPCLSVCSVVPLFLSRDPGNCRSRLTISMAVTAAS